MWEVGRQVVWSDNWRNSEQLEPKNRLICDLKILDSTVSPWLYASNGRWAPQRIPCARPMTYAVPRVSISDIVTDMHLFDNDAAAHSPGRLGETLSHALT